MGSLVDEDGRAIRLRDLELGDDLAWRPEQVFARGTGYCG